MTDNRSSPDNERAAFIKSYRHLDLTEVSDPWGRPMFMHTHVQAMWDGWFARSIVLVEAATPAHPADEMIGQIEERFPNWRSYRDLVDCIDVTLHRLRGGQ
jgi:hypothetical protein